MRLTDTDALKLYIDKEVEEDKVLEGWAFFFKAYLDDAPSIDLVRCKECKHRPIKEDPNGENYGFNLIASIEGDERCPCLVSDGWYSWMPKDDFYCGFGEREDE